MRIFHERVMCLRSRDDKRGCNSRTRTTVDYQFRLPRSLSNRPGRGTHHARAHTHSSRARHRQKHSGESLRASSAHPADTRAILESQRLRVKLVAGEEAGAVWVSSNTQPASKTRFGLVRTHPTRAPPEPDEGDTYCNDAFTLAWVCASLTLSLLLSRER
jgi:hypothetical protein